METHEKLRYRAWLLAIGADRWYDCTDRIERMKIVEILEEEFARAKAAGEPLEKERAFLVKHGIAIADLPVHVGVPVSQEEQEKVDLGHGDQACRMTTNIDVEAAHSAVVHSGTTSSLEVHENADRSQGKGLSMQLGQNTPKTRNFRNSVRRFAKISTPGTRRAHGRGGDTVGTVCRRQSRRLCGNVSRRVGVNPSSPASFT